MNAATRVRNVKILMTVVSMLLVGSVVFVSTIVLDYGSKTISEADGYTTALQLFFIIFVMATLLLGLFFILKDAKEDLEDEKESQETETE